MSEIPLWASHKYGAVTFVIHGEREEGFVVAPGGYRRDLYDKHLYNFYDDRCYLVLRIYLDHITEVD